MNQSQKLLKALNEFYSDDTFKQASGLLFQYQNEVFLLKRAKDIEDPNIWSIPGGLSEKNESPMETALRETREEIGILPGHLNTGKISEYHGEDSNIFYTTHLIESEKKFDDVILNEESQESGWFSVDKLPKNIHEGVMKALQDFKIK